MGWFDRNGSDEPRGEEIEIEHKNKIEMIRQYRVPIYQDDPGKITGRDR